MMNLIRGKKTTRKHKQCTQSERRELLQEREKRHQMKDKNALIGMAMAMAMNLSVEKQNMIQIYITKSLKVLLQTFPMFGTHVVIRN